MKELSFSTKIKFRTVEIENETGEPVKYELREMRAAVRDKYMDRLSKRLILDPKGNVIGIKSYEGMQSDLLIHCLFPETGNTPVEKSVFDKWPTSTVTALFGAAQELNLFRKPEERNRIIAEKLVEWFNSPEEPVVDANAIELIIEQTEKKLFSEKDEGESES